MAYSIYKKKDKYNFDLDITFLCDEEADVLELPVDNVAPGSLALVIETSDIYILNNALSWEVL